MQRSPGWIADRGRVALGDDPAVVEDLDPVAQVHDQRDVVGDEDDRDAQLVADAGGSAPAAPGSRRVHAGVRLVEQEDPRVRARRRGRSRAGAGRRTAGALQAGRRCSIEPEQLEQLDRAHPSSSRSLTPEGRRREQRAEQRARHVPTGAPTFTLSMTGRSPNSRMFWNVRAMPSASDRVGRRAGDRRGPRTGSSPLVGCRNPDRTWNSVVLPAPFGPITPWMVRAGSRSS